MKVLELFMSLFAISLVRYFTIAGLAFLLVYGFFSVRLRKHKIQAKAAKRSDFRREILHSVQSNLIMVLMIIPFTLPPLNAYTLSYAAVADYGWVYLIASVPVSLIIHDTYFYWMHRLLHHPQIFKQVHLLHHKSTNPSPWASYAFHATEAVAEGFILIILLFILPLHPIAIGLFILLGFIINVYGHLGYEITPKWFRHSPLFQVLNTSVHHNLHHSKFKGNYGLYFRVWDRLMGTEHPDYVKAYDKVQEQRFGIKTATTNTDTAQSSSGKLTAAAN